MFKKLNNFTIDRYYKMSDGELEKEANKWKIRGYGYSNGTINRDIIIDALLKKDASNNSRYAIIISIFAAALSLISIFVK